MTIEEKDHYIRRRFDVVAKWWSKEVDPHEMIRWLAISMLEGSHFPANGQDYHSKEQIAVRSSEQRDTHWGNRGDWFVVYPNGAISIFTESEFEEEFVAASEDLLVGTGGVITVYEQRLVQALGISYTTYTDARAVARGETPTDAEPEWDALSCIECGIKPVNLITGPSNGEKTAYCEQHGPGEEELSDDAAPDGGS